MSATHAIRVSARPFEGFACDKRPRLLRELNELTRWHASHCEPYRRILNAAYHGCSEFESFEDLPIMPVRLFKASKLVSIPSTDTVRTMVSSGTSSQGVSTIVLDKSTAVAQTRALVLIMNSLLGSKRLPMVIIDSPAIVNSGNTFSARAAAALGFSQLGYDHLYLLNNRMEVNWDALEDFMFRHKGETLFLFGFTYVIWQYFYAQSLNGPRLDFGSSVLIHGGGWKRLKDSQVSDTEFNRCLREQLGISRIHNYYGLVEQAGSIFIQCDEGHFHAPSYADVLIRHPQSLAPLPFGHSGLLQLMSNIPRSYPGHVLLTEDLGTILGEDDCPCERKGKYFCVEGRLPHAELRGCSDTYQERI